MRELLDHIVQLTGPVGLGFVLFIVLLLGAGIVRYLVPLARVTRSLKKASRRIGSDASSPDVAFRGSGKHLQSLWAAFLQERAESQLIGEASLVSPTNWFTPGRVLPRYNRSAALALAGAFAGLGILGTFVGLMIGLLRLDTAPGQVLGSVTSFIGGMSTAFWSSIFGIGASLVWLALDRGTYNLFLLRLNELHSAIRRRFPTLDSEQLLVHLVRRQDDTLDLLRSQKSILQNLGTDISAAFEQAINRTLSPAMSDISESLSVMSTQVSEQQAEALGEMAQKFQEELMGSMSSQFSSLAESVQEAADYQARVNEDVSRLFEKLVAATDGQVELIERTSQASETFASSLQAVGDMQQRLADAAGQIGTAAEHLDSVSERLATQTTEYSSANERLRELLAAQLDASASKVDELNEFFTTLSGDLQDLSKNLEHSITEFSGLATDKLGEVFHRFDSELSTVVDHLSGTLAQVRDVTEDFPRALEDLRSAIDKLVNPIEGVEGRLSEAAPLIESFDRLRTTTAETAEELRRSTSTLANLERTLERSISSRADGHPTDRGSSSFEEFDRHRRPSDES